MKILDPGIVNIFWWLLNKHEIRNYLTSIENIVVHLDKVVFLLNLCIPSFENKCLLVLSSMLVNFIFKMGINLQVNYLLPLIWIFFKWIHNYTMCFYSITYAFKTQVTRITESMQRSHTFLDMLDNLVACVILFSFYVLTTLMLLFLILRN